MEILCLYVNSAFGKEGLPNVLARFAPFKNFTHIFIAKLATFVRVFLRLAIANHSYYSHFFCSVNSMYDIQI